MKCQKCRFWILSETLGSPDTPVWHCKDGFRPSSDCQDMAEYNRESERQYYREFPEALQLKINFNR